ncbi:MAG: phosphatase PAP2 family protein [Actinomycetes bacterium]
MTHTHTQYAEGVLQDVFTTDRAIYRAIAANPTPTIDPTLRRLSNAANNSALWMSLAALLAVKPGATRRAAVRGLASVALASATSNIIGKGLARRARPDIVAAAVPAARNVRMPGSTSFPSGHAASALAFAGAVGSELPWLSFPLRLLATAVAYSRVHAGVHYPVDVVVGAAIGATSAEATTYAARRLASRPLRNVSPTAW